MAAAPGHAANVRHHAIDALSPEQVGLRAVITDALLAWLDPEGRMSGLHDRGSATSLTGDAAEGRQLPSGGYPLEDGSKTLPATDAHGLQAVAGLATLHLVGQRGEDPRTRRTHRVTQGDA